MSARNLIVAIALLTVAATAHAGLVSALPESTSVALIFVALATAGLVAGRKAPQRCSATDIEQP